MPTLPPLNLWFTTFLDAAPPAGNGWHFSQYVQHYRADKFKDNNGHTIGFPGLEVNVTVGLSQAIFTSEYQLLGGNAGINFILPEVSPHTSYDLPGPFPQEGDSGFGDLLVGPFIQWPPVMGPNGPKFFQRIELQVILPTGKYDRNRAINPGSNFWSFDPYWTGTYFFTPELTASVRAHYLWNGENDEPNNGGDPDPIFRAARHTRAGVQPCLRACMDEALRCKETGEPKTLFFNLSGHGHFDMASYDKYLAGGLEDFYYPESEVLASLERLPKIPA